MDMRQVTSHFEKKEVDVDFPSVLISLTCFSRYLHHPLTPWSLPERGIYRDYTHIPGLHHPGSRRQAKGGPPGRKSEERSGVGASATSGNLFPLTKSLSSSERMVFSAPSFALQFWVVKAPLSVVVTPL